MAEVFTSWARPPKGTREDIVGVRDLPDGRKEYLMHNEGLCEPYYLANSGPTHPEVPDEGHVEGRA